MSKKSNLTTIIIVIIIVVVVVVVVVVIIVIVVFKYLHYCNLSFISNQNTYLVLFNCICSHNNRRYFLIPN